MKEFEEKCKAPILRLGFILGNNVRVCYRLDGFPPFSIMTTQGKSSVACCCQQKNPLSRMSLTGL